MTSKNLIAIILVITIASIGVLFSGVYSFSEDKTVIFENVKIQNLTSDYAINSTCDMYSVFVNVAKNYSSVKEADKAFIGYTEDDIGNILTDAKERFYDNPSEGLAGNIDPGIYQEYIKEKSLTVFTDKAIITNDINPELKGEVRKMLEYFTESNDMEDIIRQSMLVC